MNVYSIFKRYQPKIEGDTIFDPIRQRYVHLTPEEIIRQKTIKFLMRRLKVPQEKIIVERRLSTLGVPGSKKRIDIGILDSDGLIMAVIECKVWVDEATAMQAQDYLEALNTRYFFVTDGEVFEGYHYDTVQFIRLEEIPTYNHWEDYPSCVVAGK